MRKLRERLGVFSVRVCVVPVDDSLSVSVCCDDLIVNLSVCVCCACR